MHPGPSLSPARQTLFIAWAVVLCVVGCWSLLPTLVLEKFPASAVTQNDKAVHFFAYVLLAVFPVVAAAVLRAGLSAALSMAPLGIMLEFLQRLVPSRSFEAADVIANTLGVLTGVLLGLWLRSIWPPLENAAERAGA